MIDRRNLNRAFALGFLLVLALLVIHPVVHHHDDFSERGCPLCTASHHIVVAQPPNIEIQESVIEFVEYQEYSCVPSFTSQAKNPRSPPFPPIVTA